MDTEYRILTYLTQISNSQQRILNILNSLKIPTVSVDISTPGMEEQRDFMRAGAKKKDGQTQVLPPQVFVGDRYCGVSW